jgi:hypothetical protein
MDALRSQMRKWTPQQLQAFAMQHQNDAIALSLVSQEQSEREKARASQQAMGQPQQQQQPVNQQVISKLAQLPEEVGIGQLPAQNLEEGMADGGIVGYNGSDESLVGTPPAYLNTPAGAGTPYYFPGASAERDRLNRLPLDTLKGWWNSLTGDERLQWNRVGKDKQAEAAAVWGREQRSEAAPPPPAQEMQAAPSPEQKRGRELGGLQGLAQDRGIATGQVTRPTIQSGPQSAADIYAAAKKAAGVGAPVEDPDAELRKEIEENRKAQATRELEGIGKREEGLAALMKSKEERLSGRESRLKEQEESDRNMAIIKAGLALATSTKKGFLSAVAEGATAGVDDLLKSKTLTKAERQKIEDAREAMDALRFDQGELTRKEKIAAQNKIDEVGNIAKEKSIAALAERRKIPVEEAGKLFDAGVKMYEGGLDRQSREKTTAMQVAAMRERTGPDDRKLRDAEAAISRDPEIATIKKQLESPRYAMDPAKAKPLYDRLKAIQAEKYKAFSITLPETPGAAGPGGMLKYNPATGKIE